jgi:hypothetical protein
MFRLRFSLCVSSTMVPGLGMAHAENDGRFSGINPNAHKPSRKVALEPQTTTSRLPSSLFRQS